MDGRSQSASAKRPDTHGRYRRGRPGTRSHQRDRSHTGRRNRRAQQRDFLGFKDQENPPAALDWNLWLGPAHREPFYANLHPYNWHGFWEFGNGELGNNGVHFIDVARWGLKTDLPSKVHSSGGRFGYSDQGQTPNTQLTTFQFEDGKELVVEIRGRFTPAEGDLPAASYFTARRDT
jgi:Oxidoreductase family, C-terminal alpha/beta domain